MKAAMNVIALVLGSALYGFASGSVHSTLFAVRNLVKFPLLILVTALICSLAYYVIARFTSTGLTFAQVQESVTLIFRDLSILLGSLALPVFFLAHTMEQPDAFGLNDYPLFLGFNVVLIAACGVLVVIIHTRKLLTRHGIPRGRGLTIILLWLFLSGLVGSQWAWYLRPFYGVSSIEEDIPFCLGTDPDFRGDTSFYEAVYHIVVPPELNQ